MHLPLFIRASQCVKQLRSNFQVHLPRNGKRHMLVHSGQKLSDDGDKTLLVRRLAFGIFALLY